MRRPWIKIETCTPDKPEICSIATHLKLDEDTVVGKLVRLWSWAELNRIEPNDLGVTKEFLDKLVGRKGFAAAMMQAGWLIETQGKLSFPNFKRHNSPVAQNKALTAKRVARHRLRKAKTNEKITKEPLPEPVPEPVPEASVVAETPVYEVDVPRVITGNLMLESSEVELIETAPEPTPDVEPEVTPQVEAPSASIAPEITPAEAVEILAETVATEEPAPRKRRSKAATEEADQPLLF